jgi:hypothetical protein
MSQYKFKYTIALACAIYAGAGIAQSVWQLGCGLGDLGIEVRFPAGTFSLFSTASISVFGAHPASCPVGTGGAFRGVRWSRYGADHSPPSDTEIKNDGSISPLPHTPSWPVA